jgi:uncharacterized membrane protein YtjA (UPF0391 family)
LFSVIAQGGAKMLRASIVFFVLGLLAYFFGAYGFAGVSVDIGKLLLVVFLIFSLISFIGGLATGRTNGDKLDI